jgi:hypothetical protein
MTLFCEQKKDTCKLHLEFVKCVTALRNVIHGLQKTSFTVKFRVTFRQCPLYHEL